MRPCQLLLTQPLDKPIVAADEPQQSVYGALLLDGFLSEKLIASAKIQKNMPLSRVCVQLA